ncbi:hypothetical protein [Tenacibaculum jejuense]|uniref:Uncharacterized protein n=1 Tax=Tenacibaculum jejuense TaxID=584609 RepID=A0A238UEX2_9FLAO|nr:hypothetical protein [Tenacibaculum jejuense]SNR17024.1 exported protein of unknown function [Tenacibaculum jejuense]
MTSKIKLLSVVTFCLFLGMNTVAAQKVVVKNGVEYLEEEDASEDLNSITVPSKSLQVKLKKKGNKNVVDNATIANIRKVSKKRKSLLRFRKKRKQVSNKCFKEADKKCNSIKIKKKH